MFENMKQFLVDELRVNPDDVTMEAELAGDLGINSLELADLVYLCEERFNVTIDDEEALANMEKMLDYFDECEDVTAVYHNWEN